MEGDSYILSKNVTGHPILHTLLFPGILAKHFHGSLSFILKGYYMNAQSSPKGENK